MTYQHIDVKRVVGPVGAEISGVDIGKPLAKEVVREIHDAWLAHQVVFFRDQTLTPESQAVFAANFGELDVYPFMKALNDHPNVIPIVKEADAKTNFGGGWHTDTSYLPKPPKATVLYAIDVPERGGDTLFSDTSGAYEAFSDGMKRLLDGLIGIYSAAMVHGKGGAYTLGVDLSDDYGGKSEDAEREVEHPLIRTHPETGRKAIYASLAHTARIKGMTTGESRPIIEMLHKQATQPEYTTRFNWTPGTLAMWDNRCLWHYVLNDYHGSRREMRRVIVQGDAPR